MKLRMTCTANNMKNGGGQIAQNFVRMVWSFEKFGNIAAEMGELLLVCVGQGQFSFEQNASLKINVTGIK